MKKDLKNMSIEEIFNALGKIITPENVYYFLDDKEVESEYDELYRKIKENPKSERDELIQFLLKNEKSINKEALVLLILQNYLEFRNNKSKYQDHEQYIYEIKIENCKRLLDGKDISVYGYVDDIKTGLIKDVVEISSIDLCAENKMNNLNLYPEQARVNAQRQARLRKRKEDYKRKKIKNEKRLNEITKDCNLKNILQFITVDDYEEIIIEDKRVSSVIKEMIIRNSTIKGLNIDYKQLTELMEKSDFWEYTKNIDPMVYMQEAEDTLNKNIAFYDLDKMLLVAAYRAVEKANFEKLEAEEIKSIKSILVQIYMKLNGRNTKIQGEVPELKTGEDAKVEYDLEKLKKDISRFLESGVFLTNEKMEQIKNDLLEGKINLIETTLEVAWQLGLDENEWDKLVKLSSENFIFFLDECDPGQKDIDEVKQEIKQINTECLFKLIEKGAITEEEIIQMCDNEKIKLQQLIELATIDKIKDETIIDAFNNLEDKEKDKEYLLKYFDKVKLEEYINNDKINDEFLEFYTKIIPETEEKKNEILKQIEEIVLSSKNKEALIKFYEFGLIDEKLLCKELTDEDVFELYENGKIDANISSQIYKLGIIEQDTMALIVDEEYKSGDILKGLEEGIIDLSIALELYSDKKVFGILNKYQEGIFKTPNPAIFAFMTSNIEIEDLNKLYKKGTVKEQDLRNIIMQGNISKTKITELYVNMLISEEIIDELNKNQIITVSDTELMKKALGMKNIVKNMDKSLGIAFGSDGEIEIDDGIFLPEEKTGKKEREYDVYYFPNGNKSKEPKKVISPAIRERKFEIYGAKRVKRNNVEYNEKSPFNDYEFYIIPDEQGNITPDCIVIAERYYEDKHSGEEKLIDGNATYLFELKDLTRISKKSKTEILSEMKEAKDKRMKRKLHTKNWSKNMDKAVEELLGRKLESCYTESEIHDIRTISELIDGFKDKGETYRMFDVEFY